MSADTFMIQQKGTRKMRSLLEFLLKNCPRIGLAQHAESARSFLLKNNRAYGNSSKNSSSLCLGNRDIFPLPRHSFISMPQRGKGKQITMATISDTKESGQTMPFSHSWSSLIFSPLRGVGERVRHLDMVS